MVTDYSSPNLSFIIAIIDPHPDFADKIQPEKYTYAKYIVSENQSTDTQNTKIMKINQVGKLETVTEKIVDPKALVKNVDSKSVAKNARNEIKPEEIPGTENGDSNLNPEVDSSKNYSKNDGDEINDRN